MVNVALLAPYNQPSSLLYASLNGKFGIDLVVCNNPNELNKWKDIVQKFSNSIEQKTQMYNFSYSLEEILQKVVGNNCNIIIQFDDRLSGPGGKNSNPSPGNSKNTYPNMTTINVYEIKINSNQIEYCCQVLYENDSEITTKKSGYTTQPNLKTRFNIYINLPGLQNQNSFEIVKNDGFKDFLSIIYYNNSTTLIYDVNLQSVENKSVNNSTSSSDKNMYFFRGPAKTLNKIPTTIYPLSSKYNTTVKIYPMCNWQSSKQLIDMWSKFNLTPESITFTSNKNEADYFMIINSTNEQFDPSRTLYFCMEPHMDKTHHFSDFYKRMINDRNLLFCGTHDYHVNNTEWHLSPSAKDFLSSPIPPKKYDNVLSVIVSNKNYDEGHILRLNFLRELDKRASQNNLPFGLHIYGSSDLNFKNYKGSLPPNKKDNGIFPYKYHFNAENNSIKNYITEKFTDAIVGESYMFYWGCPNINDYYDKRCYTRLSLKKEDLEKDIQTISNCMNEKVYEKNLDIIKNMKKRIIIEYNMFSRMKNIIDLSSVQVFVNVSKNILSGKNPNEFVSNIGNVLRKQGFNNTVFIQLASEISEADERSSNQLFGEMLYNFTKSGENIIFIDFRDLENIQNLRNDLSLGYGLSSREITWAKSDICNSLNEFIRYPFYMRSDVAEKMMFQINSNKNLFSLLKEFSIKTN